MFNKTDYMGLNIYMTRIQIIFVQNDLQKERQIMMDDKIKNGRWTMDNWIFSVLL